ncbi:MAG: D-arabinose 5-phosphate isomerase [Candidatus Glassbacteria bacterium RBG_16_58_8]|uniref:D-arabinose 5-phosphate isomerase n=1 Tax=Candidatus Glassbacteria bacterium RBG_16_58_8 TaxID=1817866 RepID=A0A1F5YC11_9BACT|nr:MAG: D-arabinose 5-phosphate isomerase [Candidatus Glassbacteria bacterium RBG_16_58_8]
MNRREREYLLTKAREVFRIEAEAVKALESRFGNEFLDAIELLHDCRGRVIVSGIGKSGIVAKKIASTLASTGTPALFLHPAEGIHGDLGMVVRGDVILVISKSGEMDELPQLLSLFKRLELQIIAITASTSSTLAANSDVVLDMSVKEEACPYGLAPTASTTVALAIGDALAIALLLKRGFKREDFAAIHPGGTIGKKLLFRVKDLMVARPDEIPRVSIDGTMKEAVFEMAAKRGIACVVDGNGVVVGVLTNGDLMRLVDKTEHIFHLPVREVMTATPKVIHQEELAITAVQMMEKFGIISMPVVDDEGRLSGVIHLHDLMRAGII